MLAERDSLRRRIDSSLRDETWARYGFDVCCTA
jgi:hypothetical protein